MPLNWIKCQGEVWCPLNTVNLDHPHFNGLIGVCVVWHGGPNAHTIIVGSGNIKDRLVALRQDSRLQPFARLGVFATWAGVASNEQAGVQAFLNNRLTPVIPPEPSSAAPIEVNLPW